MIYRIFQPAVAVGLYGLVGVLVMAGGVHYVSAVHAARVERQARCRAELRALRTTAFVQKFVVPADPCLAVEIVK